MPLATALFVLAATAVTAPNPIEDYMSRLERLGYSGALLVAKDGKVIVHKAYGVRDLRTKAPYTLDTVAPVGSITKQFTAAAILALEEEGKLKTTDPITKYFHDVPEDKRGITLHELLTHSAGFPGEIGDDYEAIGRDEFVKLAMGTKLLFPPGSAYEYSNVGYSLLGAIIEQVTGGSYERYLHDRLFVRAGMTQTGYVIPKFDRAKVAHGIRGGEDEGSFLDHPWAPDGPYWHLRANGGILSTPADMYRWHQALEGDKVLSAASRKKLFTPYVREGVDAPSSYAYGWAIFPMPNGHTLIAHNGGDGTFAADFRRYIDDHVVVFITSNVSDRPSIAVSRFVGRMALGQEVPMPPKVVTLTSEELHNIEGTYGDVRVTAKADGSMSLIPLTTEAFTRLSPPAGPRAPRVAEANEHAKKVVAGILARDFKPLQAAFGDRPLDVITRRQTQIRADLEAKKGAMKDITVIGTRVERQMLASVARIDFEHGTSYVVLIWDGPQHLAGLRLDDSMPGATYYPVSKTELASYDFSSGETATWKVPQAQ